MFQGVINKFCQAKMNWEELNIFSFIPISFTSTKDMKYWQCSLFPYHLITLSIMVLLYLYCLKEAIPAAFAIAPPYKFTLLNVENNDNNHSKKIRTETNNTDDNPLEDSSPSNKFKIWIRLSKILVKMNKLFFQIKDFKLPRKQISSLLHLSCGLVILIVPFVIFLVDGTRVGQWKSTPLHEYHLDTNYRCLYSIYDQEYTKPSSNNKEGISASSISSLLPSSEVLLTSRVIPVTNCSSDFKLKSLYHKDVILTLQNIDSSYYLISKDYVDENAKKSENSCIPLTQASKDKNLNDKRLSFPYHQIKEDVHQRGLIGQRLYSYHYDYRTPLWLYLTILFLSLLTILSGLHLIFIRVPAYDIASIRGYTVAITSGISYIALGALFRLRSYGIYYPVACGMAIFSLYAFIFALSDAFHHTLWFLQKKYLLHRIYPFFCYYHVQQNKKKPEIKEKKRKIHNQKYVQDEETKKGELEKKYHDKEFKEEKNQTKLDEVEQLERRYFGKGVLNKNEIPSKHTLYSILLLSLYQSPSLKAFRYTHAPSNLVTVIPVVFIAFFICTTLSQIRLLFFSSVSNLENMMIFFSEKRLFQWLLQTLDKKLSVTSLLSLFDYSSIIISIPDLSRLAYLLPWCCNNGLLATLASTYATLMGSLVLHGKMSQRKGAFLSLFMAVLPLLNIIYLHQLVNYNNKQFQLSESLNNSCHTGQKYCEMDEVLNYMNANRHGLKDLFNLLFLAFT